MSLYDKRIELVGFEEDEGRDKFQYDEVDLKKAIQELNDFEWFAEDDDWEYTLKRFEEFKKKVFGEKLCVEDLGGEQK